MCIALLSTQHPRYPLIILNNRDEFLHRPTAGASWWDTPDTAHIFSGRDLARPERGTWLGVTRQGRITILTNFRESSSAAAIGTRSRGAMVNAFLTAPDESVQPLKNWVHHVLTADGDEGCKNVGGFSLICGILHPKSGATIDDGRVRLDPLAVLSNRTLHKNRDNEAHWICGEPDQIHVLSNDPFEDPDPWPKVTLGKTILKETVDKAVIENLDEDDLVEALFGVLSHDTIPFIPGKHTYETDLESLRHSIFIPAFDVHMEGQPPAPSPAPKTAEEAPEVKYLPPPVTNGLSRNAVRPILIPPPNGNDDVHHICASPIHSHFQTGLHPPTGVPFDSPRVYGTQKQTVILVDSNGRLKYVERTLYNDNAEWVGGAENKDRDIVCEFQIEGWQE